MLSGDFIAESSHLGEDGAVGFVIGFAIQDKAARPRVPGVNSRGVQSLRCFQNPVVPEVGEFGVLSSVF